MTATEDPTTLGTTEGPTAAAVPDPAGDDRGEPGRPPGADLRDWRSLVGFDAVRSLPLVGVLIALWIWFDIATGGRFVSGLNISFILVNASQIGVVAIGVVVVLLVAEIDLSLGSQVALCGCTAALVMQEWVPNASDFERMLVGVTAAVVVGALCGVWNGFWVAVVRVPSFIVTLAGLLAFQGIALLITNAQTIGITSPYFNAFGGVASTVWNNGKLGDVSGNPKDIVHLSIGMLLAVACGVGFLIVLLLNRRDRIRHGLSSPPLWLPFLKAGVLTVVGLAVVEKLDFFFGVPLPVVVFFALLIAFAYVLKRTRYGRHIYAAGGNAEAARRAGIPVVRLRWSVFIISGAMAGVGAVIFSASSFSIGAGAVGQDFLLNCIAAAVIGGVSLFGGRGSVWGALLGALILSSVQSGMLATLGGGSSTNFYYTFIAEGGILLLCGALDTIATGGRTQGVGLWAANSYERIGPALGRLPGMKRPA